MPLRSVTVLALLAACAAFGSANARAQLHRATDSVATPASSLVLLDDALALDVNPAALGRLPGYSVAFLHSEVDASGSWLGRGDALYVAAPVLGPLALGATVQSIRPEGLAARPPGERDVDRAMAAFSIALSPGRHFAVGMTTRSFASGNARFDGLTAIDAGLLLRPNAWLSLSVVGRDLFVSRSGFGTAGLDLGSSALLSAGLRPFGTERITLDATLVMDASDSDRIAGRGGAVLDLPYLGSAAAVVEVDELGDANSAMRVLLELAVNAGQLGVAGGLVAGDGIDEPESWYAMLRADGRARNGVPMPAQVLDLELSGLSPRGMIALALVLERARTSPEIAGVLLRPRGSSMGLAYAQEIRLQIAALRAAGKPVVCHLDSGSGAEYYACAAADRILLDPAGDVRLMGVASTALLFGETLEEIGVRADFIRIGSYKSAPEQFTQSQLGEAAREETRQILDDAHRRMLADLSGDLRVSQQRVAELIDQGPLLAHSALSNKLVAAAADENDLDDELDQTFHGRRVVRALPSDASARWGKRPSIGVIVIDDDIVDGDSVEVPILDIHMTGGRTVIHELDAMARDPNIAVIVLRVDSPGGAALASDQIWRAVRRARERKPVIASMGAVAASGGYYVASAASEIWADPSTLTGSIGIFYGKVDVVGLADLLGVKIENFRRGEHAGADGIYRPFTDEERAALAEALRTYYRLFLARVAEGRGMTVEAVDAVARGRVYSGDAAQSLGLVDRLGGFASALLRARELGGLGRDAEVVVRPPRKSGLLDYLVGGGFSAALGDGENEVGDRKAVAVPKSLRPLVRAAATLDRLGVGQPLALLPYQIDL